MTHSASSHSAPATDVDSLLQLTGKTAVITGAGAGIGLAIAARLAAVGATVVIADRDEAAGAAAARSITDSGGRAVASGLEATMAASHAAVADAAVAATGRLDVWVNNAGVYRMEPLLDQDAPIWHSTMELNQTGVFHGIRAAARAMLDGSAPDGGCIVNVASIAGIRAGHPSMVAYAASKAAVMSMTTNFAAALGPRSIRVVGVAPGVVLTPAMEQHITNLAGGGADVNARAGTLPLRRMAAPDDIAKAVLFLASDLAGYVTGTTLLVDGGDGTGAGAVEPNDALLGLAR